MQLATLEVIVLARSGTHLVGALLYSPGPDVIVQVVHWN
jgi:hypothetical protein